jgi:hypothetical protein
VATFTLTNAILSRTGDGSLTLLNIGSATLTGTSSSAFDVSKWSGTVTLDGEGGDSFFNLVLSGTGTGTFTVEDTASASGDTNTLNVNGSANTTITTNEMTVGTQLVHYSDIQTLNLTGGVSGLTYYVQSLLSTVTATIVTMGAANTIDVGSTAGNSTSSPGVLSTVQGPLIIVSGGSDTLNLDDTGDDNGTLTQSTTLTTIAGTPVTIATLTGLGMGTHGIQYQGISALNINLGGPGNTIYLQGNPAITTTTINAPLGNNDLSIGSNAPAEITESTSPLTLGQSQNTGSVLDAVLGVINYNGSGSDSLNVDDSGSTIGVEGGLFATQDKTSGVWYSKLELLSASSNYASPSVTINFNGVGYLNIALSQGPSKFVVDNTYGFTSPVSATMPVINLDGNTGNDTFLIFDTHAVMNINGGSGDDYFYNFGNSAILNLNGDTGSDTFYVYASVQVTDTTTNVNTSSSGTNKVYSYRENAVVNVTGGTGGNNSLFVFGQPLYGVGTYYITATGIVGGGLDINYTNIEHLTVEGLGGDNTFYIISISIPTTIYGEGSIILPSVQSLLTALGLQLPNLTGGQATPTQNNNTFYIGAVGAAPTGSTYFPNIDGSLAGIQSSLTIYGNNGPAGPFVTNAVDTIYLDDSADTANQSFNLTSATLNGGGVVTGSGFGTGGSVTYDDQVGNLNFQMGNGSNLVTIDGNDTYIQTSIYGGRGNNSFVVNDDYALQAPLQLLGGLNTYPGNVLTINGGLLGNTFNITGNTITGLGVTSSDVLGYEEMQTLYMNAGGPTTFNVNGDSIPTWLYGGTGNDAFNVNSNVVALSLAGGEGNDTYLINANSGVLTATGDTDAGKDSFTVKANSGTLTLTGGAGADAFVINGNSGTLIANSGGGQDSFTVNALSSPATLNGVGGNDSYTVNAPLAAVLTVNGANSRSDLLTIDATTGNDYFNLTGSVISGLGAAINYSGTNLVINAGPGHDTFQIDGTSGYTTAITGGSTGNDIFNVQANTGVLDLTGGAAASSTFNLGSQAPLTGGILGNLAGPIVLTGGSGVNTLNLDDSADSTAYTGTLTASTLTGFGMGSGVTFAGINFMNLTLGSGNDIVDIQAVNALTVTDISTGTGADILNVGSLEPLAGGLLSGIQGALTINGKGSDIMNLDDTGDASSQTGSLAPSTLTGLGMGAAGIIFTGFNGVNIQLGEGGNLFTIVNTIAGMTRISGGAGNDVFNVQATSGPLALNGEGGSNTFNLGSGLLSNITSTISINGGSAARRLFGFGAVGLNTLNINDANDTANEASTLTASTLSGSGLGGVVTFVALNVMNVSMGSGNDTLTVTSLSNTTVTTINGSAGVNTASLNINGNFGGNLTLLDFATATLSVGGNFSGQLMDAGAITTVAIGGALTATGLINTGSITTMTVGGDLAGLLSVTGLLGTLRVAGGTPGQIISGNVQVITVLAGYGNVVFNLTQGGIQREILALPVGGGTLPGTLHFAFVYDAQSAAVPQVAIRITNTVPTARSFNLELVVTNSATAQFNLSRVDSSANAATGVSNIGVDGSLLTALTTPELQLFTNLTSSSPGGVVLPADSITALELANTLPVGFVNVAGIEGLAFAVLTSNGTPVSVSNPLGSTSNIQVLWNLFGSTPVLNPASDPFVVQFTVTQSVIVYAHVDTNPDLAQVMTLTDSLSNSLPITAVVRMVSTTTNSISALVQSVTLTGNGASINSNYSVANITSNGSLGNLTISGTAGATVNNAPGLGNVTAISIFGNIAVTSAGIYGVIQTTVGDIGQTILSGSQITGVTSITSNGAITGQILSRGNLISTVSTSSNFTGVIAAQGSLGVIQLGTNGTPTLNGNALIRFGGISISGADSGQVIALGNVFGNLTIGGSMTGRIAAQGQSITGLAATRLGILGNVTATNNTVSAVIASGGLIGDSLGGTAMNLGTAHGFVAAAGAVNLTGTTIAANNLLQNSTGANLSAITAIFTNNHLPLLFDTGGNLAGLELIETDLANLKDNSGVLSGTIL